MDTLLQKAKACLSPQHLTQSLETMLQVLEQYHSNLTFAGYTQPVDPVNPHLRMIAHRQDGEMF